MSKVSLSERAIQGLKTIQEDYPDIIDLIYKLEDYVIVIENPAVPAEKTLEVLRIIKKLEKYITPLEF